MGARFARDLGAAGLFFVPCPIVLVPRAERLRRPDWLVLTIGWWAGRAPPINWPGNPKGAMQGVNEKNMD